MIKDDSFWGTENTEELGEEGRMNCFGHNEFEIYGRHPRTEAGS